MRVCGHSRDLKPNNILLGNNGHVVISDLGLAIKLRKHKVLKHIAGTAGYWGPEIVRKQGTYKSSDYWSFGVMLYEMLVGHRPECKCAKNTLEWCPFGQRRLMEENAQDPSGVLKLEVVYPADKVSPEARALLEALFVADPLKRLGATGIAAIKSHAYFADVDWEAMSLLAVAPPYVPEPRTVNADSIGEVGLFSQAAVKNVTLGPEDDRVYNEGRFKFRFTSAPGVQKELVEALMKIDHPDGPNNPRNKKKSSADQVGCCTIL